MKDIKNMTPEEVQEAFVDTPDEQLFEYTVSNGWFNEADKPNLVRELLRRQRYQCMMAVHRLIDTFDGIGAPDYHDKMEVVANACKAIKELK